jgi:hypothetical protein
VGKGVTMVTVFAGVEIVYCNEAHAEYSIECGM